MSFFPSIENSYLSFSQEMLNKACAHNGIGEIFSKKFEYTDMKQSFRFIDLVIVPINTSIGIHQHSGDNIEIYIIVTGTALMQLEKNEFLVRPGDVIINQPNGTHGLLNNGSEEVKLVVLELPYKTLKGE